jgi:hypothetical protein
MASQQVTGNIGMYFAAYRLSRLGWNVMPTTRNARGIDLLIYDAAGKDTLGIQVKALSKEKPPVPLGHSIDHLMGHFWIIVTRVAKPRRVSGSAPSRTQPSSDKAGPLGSWRHSAVDLCVAVAAGGTKSQPHK